MTHTVVMAFLALSLSSTPSIYKGHKARPKPPPPTEQPAPPPSTEQPKPPPAPSEPEDDEPRRPRSPPQQNTEDPVTAFIRQNMRPIEGCFDIARGRSPRIQGEVVVEFDIDSDGRVDREQITGNTTGDTDLGHCILQAVKGWRFREQGSLGFTPTHVRHPFRLQTAP